MMQREHPENYFLTEVLSDQCSGARVGPFPEKGSPKGILRKKCLKAWKPTRACFPRVTQKNYMAIHLQIRPTTEPPTYFPFGYRYHLANEILCPGFLVGVVPCLLCVCVCVCEHLSRSRCDLYSEDSATIFRNASITGVLLLRPLSVPSVLHSYRGI